MEVVAMFVALIGGLIVIGYLMFLIAYTKELEKFIKDSEARKNAESTKVNPTDGCIPRGAGNRDM